MQEYLSFLMLHWPVCLGILIVLILIIIEERKASGGGFAIQIAAAITLINREKAMVVDFRPHDQFASGHVLDALNVPYDDIDSYQATLNKHQSQPLILICPTNKSASVLLVKMRKLGFSKLHLLAGGIEAWKKAELPLVKKGGRHA